jgi:catechol 2,3-dioxygenase-like lactoylglutathione lyase family enzyme
MSAVIKSFDHFGVATDDFERTCLLYEKVLGLKAIPKPPMGPKFTLAWYADEDGNEIHINQRDESFAPPGTFNRALINHVAFEVPSLDDAKVELEKAGFAYWETPRGEGVLHRKQLYVTDEPSGLILELFENTADVQAP